MAALVDKEHAIDRALQMYVVSRPKKCAYKAKELGGGCWGWTVVRMNVSKEKHSNLGFAFLFFQA